MCAKKDLVFTRICSKTISTSGYKVQGKKKIATQNSLSGKIITFIIAGKRKNVPVIKAVWNYREKRHMGQWNRIESRNKPTHDGQLIYKKGGKDVQ